MILEIKTTAQFNEVAERLFNENIHRLSKEMPVYHKMLMKDKDEMNRFSNYYRYDESLILRGT